MSSKIMDRILASPSLPSMPIVAIKVLELTQKEDVSTNDIADVIQKDPALTAKLLQTANSSLFGLPKKVGSIQQATVILGLRTVKVMALSFSLVDTFQQSGDDGYDYRRYWRRSLTSAVVSQGFALHRSDLRADECFVGGLLADIGILAARQCVGHLYHPVVERLAAGAQPIQDIEEEVLGLSHPQISSALLREWSLPDMLCDAIAAHHGQGLESLDKRTRLLASVMYASASVAEVFNGDVDSERLDDVKERCLELISISPAALEETLDDLHTNVTDMAALFKLEIGESVSYDALRSQAMMQLARISLSAERDRTEAAQLAKQAQHELEELSRKASIDGLTQIANRQAFDEKLKEVLEQARAEGGSVSLIMLDLDRFKKLNDTYGHQAGDEVLRRVGECLKTACQAPATAARYGGEEFAVILTDATTRAVQTLAEMIRQRIEGLSFDYDNQPIRCTASLGAAHVDLKRELATPKDIIERADECLYDAKRSGRNRVEITF